MCATCLRLLRLQALAVPLVTDFTGGASGASGRAGIAITELAYDHNTIKSVTSTYPWPPHWPYLGEVAPEPPVGAEVGAAEVGAAEVGAEVGLAVEVGAAEEEGALPPAAAPLESEIWAFPPPDQDSTAMTWKL